MILLHEDPPETHLGILLAADDNVKLMMVLFPSIILAIAVGSSLYAWYDHDKGWLLAAILFQTGFACSCHLLHDETKHIVCALGTMATSFVVVCCLMRIDQLHDESAKLGKDRRAEKKASIIDLPDLTLHGLSYLTYVTSGACVFLAFGWGYTFVAIQDFRSTDNLTDKFDIFMSMGLMITLVLLSSSSFYGVALSQRVYIILSASIALVAFSSIAIVSTNVMNLGQRWRDICNSLNQDSSANPNWLEWGNHEEFFWAWNELEVTVDQAVAGFASQGNTADNLRILQLFDGTGNECDDYVNVRDWFDVLIFLSMFITLIHTWCCFRLSEKLQKNNLSVSTFLGLDLVKDLDSYMDPIQFILFGCAVGIICLYRILVALDIQDAYNIDVCFDPPVEIPELSLTCVQIAAGDRCGELSDSRLCPLSCNLPCNSQDPIITSAQMVAQHLIPALTFCVVGILNYLNARDGVEFDKEWSNAIWFLCVWGSGTTIFFGVLNMIQGNETSDWTVIHPINLGEWFHKVYQTVGFLKVVGGVALLANVTFANMYAEALEDNPEEAEKEIELTHTASSPRSRVPGSSDSRLAE